MTSSLLFKDGFRERGALGAILVFGTPRRCDLFGHWSEKHESMPLLCKGVGAGKFWGKFFPKLARKVFVRLLPTNIIP